MARQSHRFLATAALVYLTSGPAAPSLSAQPVESIAGRYRAAADRIIAAALGDSSAYERLTQLVDQFGHRFSGSENLELALDWILAEMERDGLENVRGEPVMVPRWVRGAESVELLEPRHKNLPMLGLGGSIATPHGGITAELLVVESFAELTERAAEARGRIVLFNAPWDGYGPTVQYRGRGAIAAAQVGAVASLIRSVTPFSMNTPHTGAMSYSDEVERIPHAAITAEDAALLMRLQQAGERLVVHLEMEAQTLPDVESRNAVAEIVGSERPDEIVVLGGHIDSWDVGQGAMDDGGGCVAAWEAVKLLKRLNLRPRRTVRVVLWTNEENGLRGGTAYRDAHRDELDNHILAIESDAGVFEPTGFGFSGSEAALEMVREIATLLVPVGTVTVSRGGGGADIGPIMREDVPGMGLQVDGTCYFWYHHTEADTIDKLDPREMALCVAAMAVMSYVVADMDERLPRD
ncbi:MAG: M20/M25/M40 family metallo-hydrolase [Gemmatimonadota bacterium]|nr:MAG: M20/M25/M40 family metallo-hydrolase [Gemmatimonadota bacterium]